jgi:8-oxo-dGTP pyrophosphatase MutT (NUDIX family)
MSVFRFDEREVRERASKFLLSDPPVVYGRSDDDLNLDLDGRQGGENAAAAAVLVPIIVREPEDKGDGTEIAAALREAEEETGLPPSNVEPVGFLDGYLTRTGYRIVPVVGMVKPGFELKLQVDEVEAVFEVPLRFLMSPENHKIHSREWQGSVRHFYAMPFGNRYIWGATAGMLKSLYDRLYGKTGVA